MLKGLLPHLAKHGGKAPLTIEGAAPEF